MSGGEKRRRLVRLTALVVLGDWDELAALRRAAPAGEPDREWREALLQSHLFAGFPRLVEALEVLARAGGTGEAGAEEVEGPGAPALGRGAELFEAIYGASADTVRARLAALHPELSVWIAEHAYGRVLSRPGLAGATRELCAVAALAATGQDRQLASHARGALRLGASPAELREALDSVADLVDGERVARARAVLERVERLER